MDPDRQTPERIGRYRILRPLGKGGMGIVSVAVADGAEREVALKVLDQRLADADESQRRFLREVRALASVRHPHVVGCLDFGIDDGHVFLATELMAEAGGSGRGEKVHCRKPTTWCIAPPPDGQRQEPARGLRRGNIRRGGLISRLIIAA